LTTVVDYRKLLEGLEKRGAFVLVTLLYVGVALGVLVIAAALGYPAWIPLVVASVSPVFVVVLILFWKSAGAHLEAWSQVEGILHEEWRTGRPILPPDFPVGRWYGAFREPPPLSERDLVRLRRAAWFGGPRSTPMISTWAVLFFSAFLAVLFAVLAFDFPRWWLIPVLVVGLAPMFGGMLWTWRASNLLYHLRKYGELSGRHVLPPDLRKVS